MKNMILQAKNFKVFALCSLFLVGLTACKGNGKNEPSTLISDKEKPSWTAPVDDYDMSSSMTATVKVDLTINYPKLIKDAERSIGEGDLLAAFAGNKCIGVTTPQEGLFFLYITPPAEADAVITLHYYSSILKNLFVAEETFTFANDTQLGSYTEPYTPTFVVAQ